MKNKFGFRTFIKGVNPIARPGRPFDIKRDLTVLTKLWVNITPKRGLVTNRSTGFTSYVTFTNYERNGEAYCLLHIGSRFVSIPLSYLHIGEAA